MNVYKTVAYLFVCGLLPLLAASCRKDAPSIEEPTPIFGEPAVRTKGQPTGSLISAVIGPNGGTLRYEDLLWLEIPAGAVSQPTLFGIQPITNTLDEEAVSPAFRLTPEGMHFNKPVKISFLYDPLAGGNPVARTVAFQRNDSVWCGVSTALSEAQRQLTVETTHFSDWTWFDRMSLRKDRESVGPGETVNLKLLEQVLGELVPTNHIDSVPLAAMDDIGFSRDVTVSGWRIVSGPGSLDPKVNTHLVPGNAVYTAPAAINEATEVEIQVEVESKNGYISDRTAPNGRRKLGKLILLTKIRLEPANTFVLKANGQSYDLSGSVVAHILHDRIVIRAADDQQSVAVDLHCYGSGAMGNYPGGSHNGQSLLQIQRPGGIQHNLVNYYRTCNNERIYSGVTSITRVDSSIEGTFSGEGYLFTHQTCDPPAPFVVTMAFKIAFF